MTTKYSGFIVALDKDIRDDDVKSTLNAIRMVKGVIKVTPVEGGKADVFIERVRVITEIKESLYKLCASL